MRIGLITAFDIDDLHSFSGSGYFMASALRRHAGEIEVIRVRRPAWQQKVDWLLERLVRRLPLRLPWRPPVAFGSAAARHQARTAIAAGQFDVLIAFLSSAEAASLPPGNRPPLVFMSDATYDLVRGYYDFASDLPAAADAWYERTEAGAIANADLCIYPTSWAAASAISHYGKPAAATAIVPYGANLLEIPAAAEVLDRRSGPLSRQPRVLLMAKGDFRRKADNILGILDSAIAQGVDLQLTVCGFRDRPDISHPNLEFIPYLDKKKPEDRRRMHELYWNADFFLLPTRADTFGIVFCEAMAYGLPVITTRTGGVPNVVNDGVTGLILDVDAPPEQFAAAIAGLVADQDRRRAMATAGRADYDLRLNWDAFGKSIAGHLERLVAEAKGKR
jgi:glycosyltransferase involved in cell wall biosynthesis